MLSLSHNFLFIHIPKTAGNAIQNVLRKYSEDEIVCLTPLQDGFERFELRNKDYPITKHSTLSEYMVNLESAIYDKLYKISCIRNPWDRMVSYYFSPHRQVTEFRRDEFIALIRSAQPMLAYLAENRISNDNIIPEQICCDIDYVMRFEYLQEDFDIVCDKIGLSNKTLPQRNISKRFNTSLYYDDETISLVSDKFKDDIAYFDYEVPF